MPKCLNDTTKSYTGNELTPKGIGYSASGESTGKIMEGKDGNTWIVEETIRYKRWKKVNNTIKTIKSNKADKPDKANKSDKSTIDFDNLPDKFYTDAYFPEYLKIMEDEETGLEEKFGGSKPFFIKGESWPVVNELSLTFCCQFKDPRKSDLFLYRVFLPCDNDIEDYELNDYFIDKIELNEENLKNQIFIERPKIEDDDEDDQDDDNAFIQFKPFKIIDWKLKKELKSLEYILSNFNSKNKKKNMNIEEYYVKYDENRHTPSTSIKIAGTPVYCQYKNDSNDIDKCPKLLQISGCKEFQYDWGDCGIAHISEDLVLDWDC